MPFMETEEPDGNGGGKASGSQNSSGSGSPQGSTWNVDASKRYSSPGNQLRNSVRFFVVLNFSKIIIIACSIKLVDVAENFPLKFL